MPHHGMVRRNLPRKCTRRRHCLLLLLLRNCVFWRLSFFLSLRLCKIRYSCTKATIIRVIWNLIDIDIYYSNNYSYTRHEAKMLTNNYEFWRNIPDEYYIDLILKLVFLKIIIIFNMKTETEDIQHKIAFLYLSTDLPFLCFPLVSVCCLNLSSMCS